MHKFGAIIISFLLFLPIQTFASNDNTDLDEYSKLLCDKGDCAPNVKIIGDEFEDTITRTIYNEYGSGMLHKIGSENGKEQFKIEMHVREIDLSGESAAFRAPFIIKIRDNKKNLFTKISQSEDGLFEYRFTKVTINVSKNYLKKHSNTGLKFKLYGHNGFEGYCAFPSSWIRAVLSSAKTTPEAEKAAEKAKQEKLELAKRQREAQERYEREEIEYEKRLQAEDIARRQRNCEDWNRRVDSGQYFRPKKDCDPNSETFEQDLKPKSTSSFNPFKGVENGMRNLRKSLFNN
jgi:hypothetical protein